MSTATAPINSQFASTDRIPFYRLVLVELRKMFDTRAGFWLMASVVIVAVITSAAVVAFGPDEAITYGMFGFAFGLPMSVLLPIIAIMSVTSEWTQRTGLVTFAQVPNRAEVIAAKVAASVVVGATAIPITYAIGAIGNVVGAALNGIDPVWDSSWSVFFRVILVNVLSMLIGFMLGALFRNTAVAIVLYFVYAFVIPTVFAVLAGLQDWFEKIQPWVDFNFAIGRLVGTNAPDAEAWAQLGVSGLIWLVIPLAAGIALIMKSEVK